METNVFNVSLAKNPAITINITPGHFTTNNAHTNNYLDVSNLKSNTVIAKDVAQEFAIPYISNTFVDTIVCMEKMEVIGAYLAQSLSQDGNSVSTGNKIYVVSPISNAYGNLIFPTSVVEWIAGKSVLLLMASISSGRTLSGGIECINYYGGKLVGVSALYLASNVRSDMTIYPLFTSEDIPGYKLYSTNECELCKKGVKLDAIISSEGYTKLQ